jgi:hypothetical protein
MPPYKMDNVGDDPSVIPSNCYHIVGRTHHSDLVKNLSQQQTDSSGLSECRAMNNAQHGHIHGLTHGSDPTV